MQGANLTDRFDSARFKPPTEFVVDGLGVNKAILAAQPKLSETGYEPANFVTQRLLVPENSSARTRVVPYMARCSRLETGTR